MVMIMGSRKVISISEQLYNELETIRNICGYRSFGAVIEQVMPQLKLRTAQQILSQQMFLIEAFGYDPLEFIQSLDVDVAVKNFDMLYENFSKYPATE